jgi:hypothetical protein
VYSPTILLIGQEPMVGEYAHSTQAPNEWTLRSDHSFGADGIKMREEQLLRRSSAGTTRRSALTAAGRAALTAARRTALAALLSALTLAALTTLPLCRRQDFRQLFLAVRFKSGDLRLLVGGKGHLFLGKPGNQMHATTAGWASLLASTGRTALTAARRATSAALLRRRTLWLIVSRMNAVGEHQPAQNRYCQSQHRKTLHSELLAAKDGD